MVSKEKPEVLKEQIKRPAKAATKTTKKAKTHADREKLKLKESLE